MTVWGKLWRWLLPISLAINVFFFVVAVRHRPFMHPHPPNAHDIVNYLKANLPAADQVIMEKSFAEHFNALTDARRINPDFANHIRAALIAQPFDVEALKKVLSEGRSQKLTMENALEAAFLEAATKISPEGRAKLADRALDHPREVGGPGDFHHRGPPPPPN
jgi:uncharacterized membrane protein